MNTELRLCPTCGSPCVDSSELAGSAASCRTCKWSGVREELLLVQLKHDFMSNDGVALSMLNDLRKLLAGKLGVPYLDFLLRWGFLSGDRSRLAETVDKRAFSRYIMAIAKSIFEAIVAERERSVSQTIGGPSA